MIFEHFFFDAQKSLQKTGQDRPRAPRGGSSAPSWACLGCVLSGLGFVLGLSWGEEGPRRPKMAPREPKRVPREPQAVPREPQTVPKWLSWALLGLAWVRVGICWALLGLSWALLGFSWTFLGLSWVLLGSLGALLGLSEALLGLSWRAKPFYCKPFTLHFLWSCSFPWAGMGLAHFAQLAELSKGCNGLGWAGLSKGCTGLG